MVSSVEASSCLQFIAAFWSMFGFSNPVCIISKGVFNSMVEWCLVLTTKEEAMLCVVAKSSPAIGAPWTVIPTKFVIPSDWVSFLCVGASKNGRIFLGGDDGNLYELDYDILNAPPSNFSNDRRGYGPSDAIQQQLDRFYDGSDDISKGPDSATACPDVLVDKSLVAFQSSTEYLTHIGKRAFDAAFASRIQTRGRADNYAPPRKCRKLNHSNRGIWKHVLPEFVTKVGSLVFGDASSAAGGPITQIVIDDERQLLYTLSSPKGWICVFDMFASATTAKSTGPGATQPASFHKQTNTLTLAAILDMPSTARSYLESVARGRLNPTSTMHSKLAGKMTFLGNSDAAQAGVGGMDGARRILRDVDSDKPTTQRGTMGGTKNGSRNGINILTPVSLQIIPCRESTRITVLAVTAGGLRHYLSTLDSRNIGTGPPPSRSGQNPWKPPSNRMTLYHIRAPPPVDAVSSNPRGIAPATLSNLRVDALCYRHGNLLVAFEPMSQGRFSNKDTLIAVSHDYSRRCNMKNTKDVADSEAFLSPGGICELVSSNVSSASGKSGGRVWDIEPAALRDSKIIFLSIHSKTPSDSELNYIVPPYIPSTMKWGNDSTSKSSHSTAARSVVPAIKRGAVVSPAFGIMMNILFGRPASYGIRVQEPNGKTLTKVPSYRISINSGSDGFSKSAADVGTQLKPGPVSRSPRLSSWLLHPDFVPLEPLAIQHLESFETTFVALNVGGIHSYKYVSTLGKLREAILAAGSNADRDPKVGRFFEDYGFSEGCAMCFMLMVSPLSNDQLKTWIVQTVLMHSYSPRLVSNTEDHSSISQPTLKDDPWIPNGFMLKGSALCEGLYMAVARLLRPIWFKPAVVVTEGRIVKRGTRSILTPAKVELLLDDETLNEIARPLLNMKATMEELKHAVVNVPTRDGNSGVAIDPNLMVTAARKAEERNIHSIYRLLSRTTQLLNLLYYLYRADSLPEMPEVEWGLLHGIQFAQLVETPWGQERIENVLNKLVTSTEKSMSHSADANNLAEMLSEHCYHFFSSGNRDAFLGFQAAHEALALPVGHPRRKLRTAEAADFLLKASRFWHSPTLITGQLLQTQDSEKFTAVAERAIQQNSPLAKACACLVELESVGSVVDVCLATASNFSENSLPLAKASLESTNFRGYYWESGLYHKKHSLLSQQASGGSPGKTTPTGTNVTPKEAINTCYSLIFYYLSRFLDSPTTSAPYKLGEQMVSVCAFQSDQGFLHAFFSFMLDDNHRGVLLRLISPSLEAWLMGKQNKDPRLLLNYYQIQDNLSKAGQLAFSRAIDRFSEISIDERIEYLEIAVAALTEALSRGEDVAQVKAGAEIKLEIAKLQRETLIAMGSTSFIATEDILKKLDTMLLDESNLYNDYAWRFELFDICLKLFAVCKTDDPTNIKVLWKSAISASVLPCSTRKNDVFRQLQQFVEGSDIEGGKEKISLLDVSESSSNPLFDDGMWVSKLEETVVRLGTDILGRMAVYVFPVEFVASCLEGTYACPIVTFATTERVISLPLPSCRVAHNFRRYKPIK
jgi:Nup133 N terminal like